MERSIPYEIVRSYSRTVQVKQYEPESFFASHKNTVYSEDYESQEIFELEVRKRSEILYQRAKQDVELAVADRLGSAEKQTSGEDDPY